MFSFWIFFQSYHCLDRLLHHAIHEVIYNTTIIFFFKWAWGVSEDKVSEWDEWMEGASFSCEKETNCLTIVTMITAIHWSQNKPRVIVKRFTFSDDTLSQANKTKKQKKYHTSKKKKKKSCRDPIKRDTTLSVSHDNASKYLINCILLFQFFF